MQGRWRLEHRPYDDGLWMGWDEDVPLAEGGHSLGDLIATFQYPQGGYGKHSVSLFTAVHSKRISDNSRSRLSEVQVRYL